MADKQFITKPAGQALLTAVENEQLRKDIPEILSGDTVRLQVKVVEGTRGSCQNPRRLGAGPRDTDNHKVTDRRRHDRPVGHTGTRMQDLASARPCPAGRGGEHVEVEHGCRGRMRAAANTRAEKHSDSDGDGNNHRHDSGNERGEKTPMARLSRALFESGHHGGMLAPRDAEPR